MKLNEPILIIDRHLSFAWARAFLGVLDGSISECLTLTIRGFEGELPTEDQEIRDAIDASLRSRSIPTVAQTALSIVPYKQWLKAGRPSVDEISPWYLNRLLPRLKARSSKNRRGTYFERLVAYTGCRKRHGKIELRDINQLDYVISLWKKRAAKGSRPRQSALQLACFDPAKDDNGSALAGFPCLQQISLAYKEPGTIELNAYYPTQYLFERGYGNYLGLCQLGHFIAHQLDVRFTALTCFVGRPELGAGTKASQRELAKFLRERLRNRDSDDADDTPVTATTSA
jgi:hypothetical protein